MKELSVWFSQVDTITYKVRHTFKVQPDVVESKKHDDEQSKAELLSRDLDIKSESPEKRTK